MEEGEEEGVRGRVEGGGSRCKEGGEEEGRGSEGGEGRRVAAEGSPAPRERRGRGRLCPPRAGRQGWCWQASRTHTASRSACQALLHDVRGGRGEGGGREGGEEGRGRER